MVGDIKLEEPSGTIDGVNVSFTTSASFNPFVVNVWHNGDLVKQSDDDGFVVTGSNSFDMKEAPRLGDTLHVRYEES